MRGSNNREYFLTRIVSFILRRTGKGRSFMIPKDVVESDRLLLIDSGDATDLLFAAPVINYFHSNHPSIKTTFIVEGKNAEIVKDMIHVHRIITYERNQLRLFRADYLALIRKLKRQSMETAIILCRRFSLERYLLAFACGARIRIGFAHPLAFPFLNCEIRVSEDGYEGNKMSELLRNIGLKMDGKIEPMSLSQKQTKHARQLIHFRKPEKECLMVGIDPSRGKTKHQVIPEIIAYLANNLASRRKVKFLILADPWEERVVRTLTGELKGEVVDLKPADVNDAVAFMSQCDLFLSGNTNLFHFAAALRVPTIGLFTKYDDSRWIPSHTENVRIFKGMRGEKLSLKDFFTKVEEVLSTEENVSV